MEVATMFAGTAGVTAVHGTSAVTTVHSTAAVLICMEEQL